ncbi:MgtC/SapB family protein [Planctomycetales bacterium ZRK34]|nr:MgtC/SapB family protein [Planctomycetales bacterium ZRK34]
MDWLPQLQLIGQVVAAGVLGGLVGAEREWSKKPAGLRTHMLVAAGACLFMLLGETIVEQFAVESENTIVSADPVRIMQAIIVGISFLGAGTIITNDHQQRIEGLTTAASVLLTTAVGIAVALDQWILAAGVSILTLIVLRLMSLANKEIHDAREQVDGEDDQK